MLERNIKRKILNVDGDNVMAMDAIGGSGGLRGALTTYGKKLDRVLREKNTEASAASTAVIDPLQIEKSIMKLLKGGPRMRVKSALFPIV